ncbi:hypothetical protein GCM10010266_42240 [Streptomyces griseomycini]|nr:hypothetical protein GCM10010266_42240 [Streptomyces griseomycini]
MVRTRVAKRGAGARAGGRRERSAPRVKPVHRPGAPRTLPARAGSVVNWSRPFSGATAQDGGSPARTAAGPVPPALGRRPREGPRGLGSAEPRALGPARPQICQDRSRSAAP